MGEVGLRLLGPMALTVDGRAVPLGPARQRTVLAALAVDAGSPVRADVLIGRVWDDDPPDGVLSGLYSYVTRLRRVLRVAGDRIRLRNSSGGYVLDIAPGAVDALEFRRLARAADQQPDERAASLLDQALELWHGPALADLSGAWVERTRQRLEEQRLDAVLRWAQAQLAADRPGAVIDRLRDLAVLHPLVEPLAARLIDALHRDGRSAEALEHYAAVRRHLIDELGTEPGAELRAGYQAVLRGEQQPRAMRTHTLPADTGAFTGRAREIREIIAAAGRGRVLFVHAVAGMPGVGKTALAVHVAHRLADRFPAGNIFVDLHGHTAGRSPAEPADVLATLLTADGLDPRLLPAGVEARSALWRQRIRDRRMLIVFDNAVDSAQVSPLLPATGGCLVLVTSRRFLGDLPADAVPVSLDVLAPGEAAQMFVRLAPRAAAHPEQVAELVAACGYLPLAVSLLARVLGRHSGWRVADLMTEVRARLLDVTAEHASIAAAFTLSYRDLPTDRQRFLRQLALHPGTQIEPSAAGALSGQAPAAAAAALDALHTDSLLIEVGYHRYAMHDLIRSYAATLAAEDPLDERRAANDRLLDFYQRAASAADQRLRRLPRPSTVEEIEIGAPALNTADEALSWLRTERANLLACLAATEQPVRIVRLTGGVAELLRRDGPWADALVLHKAAAAAASELGDPLTQASALVDLGTLRRLCGDYPGAEEDMRQAAAQYREAGSSLGEANALTGLGMALSRGGNYRLAADVVQQARALYRSLGEPHGEAGALVELAVARGMTSDFRGAQEVLREALALYRRLGDQRGEAYALRILGIAHGRVGDYPGALQRLRPALELYRQLGGRLGEALALTDVGRAEIGVGNYAGATLTLRTALELHRRIDHRIGQSKALLYLGSALRGAGSLPDAAAALGEALDLDRELGNRSGEAMVLHELGAVRRLAGDVERAVEAHQQALELATQLDSPWDEAQSLAGLGRCALALGRREQARARLTAALAILQGISAAEATEVAADLAALG
jgi:DNA-binding SARP family transcriptional activator/tetratricopeptide (TPR) repeat protein